MIKIKHSSHRTTRERSVSYLHSKKLMTIDKLYSYSILLLQVGPNEQNVLELCYTIQLRHDRVNFVPRRSSQTGKAVNKSSFLTAEYPKLLCCILHLEKSHQPSTIYSRCCKLESCSKVSARVFRYEHKVSNLGR